MWAAPKRPTGSSTAAASAPRPAAYTLGLVVGVAAVGLERLDEAAVAGHGAPSARRAGRGRRCGRRPGTPRRRRARSSTAATRPSPRSCRSARRAGCRARRRSVAGSSADVVSSSSSSAGRRTSARASAMRWRWPPLRRDAALADHRVEAVRAGRRRSASARARRSASHSVVVVEALDAEHEVVADRCRRTGTPPGTRSPARRRRARPCRSSGGTSPATISTSVRLAGRRSDRRRRRCARARCRARRRASVGAVSPREREADVVELHAPPSGAATPIVRRGVGLDRLVEPCAHAAASRRTSAAARTARSRSAAAGTRAA